MRIPANPSFNWDKANIAKNFNKHGIHFWEAEEIFMDQRRVVVEDRQYSTEEERRFCIYGKTRTRRKLFAAFTMRKQEIRVISVREMTQKESKFYERQKKNS